MNDYNTNPLFGEIRPADPDDSVRCPACGADRFSRIRYRKARRRILWLRALPERVEITCGTCRHLFSRRPGMQRVESRQRYNPYGA